MSGRKTKAVTIEAPGRDHGKVFLLRERDAISAWKWGLRAMLALTKTGMQIPDEVMKMGPVGLLAIGLYRLQFIAWDDMEPLLEDMLGCVSMIPTPARPDVVRPLIRDGVNDDIAEWGTLSVLAKEVFELHTGFFPDAIQSTSQEAGGEKGAIP